MSTSSLHYFVDANLFLQCRPLEQLDWSPWDGFQEVRLIVSSPVLREIDNLKNKGNDRVGSRARETSSMFRRMLNDGKLVVRATGPRVILSIEPQHSYSKEVEDRLNYQERDDQLAGTVYEFSQRHQGSDVRLLTHDTTPLYTALGLGLSADIISDDWLLLPETTETEKELTNLRLENARFRKAEPSFAIRCTDHTGGDVERCESSFTWFTPLTESEVGGLMRQLKARFPLEDDYGSRKPAERSVRRTVMDHILGTKHVFTPTTDEEIAHYRDKSYPDWLEKCEQILRDHHRTLQHETPVPEFTYLAVNTGTRPATSALVAIEACGNFQVRPSTSGEVDDDQHDELDEESQQRNANELPRPPVAPSGQWRTMTGGRPHGALNALDMLDRSLGRLLNMAHSRTSIFDYQSPNSTIFRPRSHDPNVFYYKPNRSTIPQDSFSLKCDQWRHEDGEESFDCQIHVPTDQDEVKGALLFRIQAANLSKPASKHIPIQIAITHVSAFESAQAMVERLVESPKFQIKLS